MAKNTVVVSITANTKDLQKGLGQSQSILGKLGGVAGIAVKSVAAVGVALAGVAVAGGFARALKLDDANTKLKALKYNTAQVEEITKSALVSVKGTAFGLDSAVNSAVGLLAAGVKPGQDLTRVLSTISNTAGLAGTSLDDMGSIFNKVYANGKVTTMEMNQLADRGVPIWQYLGESLGVNNSELRKMIEAGTVTAEMFESALGPAVDGVAKTMGGSFKGMLANAGASLGRLGALFAGPLLANSKGALGEFTTLVDGIASALEPVAARFSKFLEGISFDGAADRILAGFTEIGQNGMSGLLDALVQGITSAAAWLSAGGAYTLVSGLVSSRSAMLDAALTVFPAILDALVQSIPAIVEGLVALVNQLGLLLTDQSPTILAGAVLLFESLVTALVTILPGIITTLLTMLPRLVENLLSMIPAILDAAISLFTSLVEALPLVLPPLIAAIVAILPKLVETILNMIPKILDAAIDLFTALVQSLPVILPLLLNAIITLLPKIITTVIGMIPRLLTAAIDLFVALVTAVPKIIPELIPALLGLLPAIIGAIISLIPALIGAGVDLIGGLISGMAKMGKALGDALINIAKGAIKGFLGFLGIKSPSRLFMGFGGNLGEGLAIGIGKSGKAVSKALDGMSSLVTDGFDAKLGTPDMQFAVAGGAAAASRGNTYNIELHTLNATAETGRIIVESIRDYENAGGRL